jgi:uncharacterized membrane protein YeaQ/YmgE (transglycosylase-associated protein family)
LLIFAILGFGILVGWFAQMALGMGSKPTGSMIIAGIAGSFVGGLLISLIAGDGFQLKLSGFIGSFVGAVIVLAVWGLYTRTRDKP